MEMSKRFLPRQNSDNVNISVQILDCVCIYLPQDPWHVVVNFDSVACKPACPGNGPVCAFDCLLSVECGRHVSDRLWKKSGKC